MADLFVNILRRRLANLREAHTSVQHLWLMLLLTFATGIVDAIGFLGLDRVFTGNMTGNVVILGMGLAGADELPVLGPVLALIGFFAGAAGAGRTLVGSDLGWSRRITGLLVVTACVEIAAGAALLVGTDPDGSAFQLTLTTVVGAGMGVQAAAARHVSVKDVTTVVVTSTITGLAVDSLARPRKPGNVRRVAAILLILCGAAAGALLLQWHVSAGFFLAGCLTAVAAVAGAILGQVK